ncbi:MAG: calcium-translocating P-type ATPase, PMCA-type [Spirochaetota bacterium]|jgi:Ca2+-transporting ATPase|nr:calcium-translocating P-type ATPase, PMCA-type [Spirochaetota bacterium]
MPNQYAGLTPEEVLASRARHGANVLSPPQRTVWWRAYLEKFNDPIIRILGIAAFLSIAIGAAHDNYLEGVAIVVTIFLATFIAFWNERRAAAEFDVLNRVNDDIEVRAIRGEAQAIPRKDLVVGDIILLETGEETPADAEVLEAYSLEVDESKLTGESHPVAKKPREAGEVPDAAYPSFRIMKGTLVADGHGVFRIEKVGEASEIGAVARLAAEETQNETPLMRQLAHLARILGVVAFVVAAAFFMVLFARGIMTKQFALASAEWALLGVLVAALLILLHRVWLPVLFDLPLLLGREPSPPAWLGRAGWKSWTLSTVLAFLVGGGGIYVLTANGSLPAAVADWLPSAVLMEILAYFMAAVALIVVAVPEGLPLSVTLALSYNMRKMVANNALVRRLYACETIGAVTVICSDKTGTLTANRMRVAAMQSRAEQSLVNFAIAANSTALLEAREGEESRVLGNPTEGALLLWLESQGISWQKLREGARLERQWTFTTERKFMASVVTGEPGRFLLVKGAPEYVMERCADIAAEERSSGMASEIKAALQDEIYSYQKRGMRTIGFAARRLAEGAPVTDNLEEQANDLVWFGFAAIEDPVRSDVPAAIASCMSAGVAVKVVTGDTPETAREIARQIGLWQESDEQAEYAITTGDALEAWTDEELEVRAPGLKIVARARPKNKLRLVKCLQKLGEVVAVTGDGTNDAPALNHADVGLAMGKTGTAVSREASDIVLLDDSFVSIVRAILWGRSIYLNIQRFLIFQVTINLVAVCIVLAGPFLGIALPLTVIQMLWVNLIMDTLAALALATEPPDDALLLRPPRSRKEGIITRAMGVEIVRNAVLFLALLITMMVVFIDGSTRWLTIFFTVFVFLQVWNMLNMRFFARERVPARAFFGNRSFWLVTLAIVLGQIIIVQFGGEVFRAEPLHITEWGVIALVSSCVFLLGRARRFCRRPQNTGA